MYRVLRTVGDDGQMLTHLPTADRLVGGAHVNYAVALAEAMALRTALYQHKKTGEQRLLSELATSSAVTRDDDAAEEAVEVWRFARASTYLAPRGYALVVAEADLCLYEPKPVRA